MLQFSYFLLRCFYILTRVLLWLKILLDLIKDTHRSVEGFLADSLSKNQTTRTREVPSPFLLRSMMVAVGVFSTAESVELRNRFVTRTDLRMVVKVFLLLWRFFRVFFSHGITLYQRVSSRSWYSTTQINPGRTVLMKEETRNHCCLSLIWPLWQSGSMETSPESKTHESCLKNSDCEEQCLKLRLNYLDSVLNIISGVNKPSTNISTSWWWQCQPQGLVRVILGYQHLELDQRFSYLHDDKPKHTEKATQAWLRDCFMNLLRWTNQSPDLDPVSHLWRELKVTPPTVPIQPD